MMDTLKINGLSGEFISIIYVTSLYSISPSLRSLELESDKIQLVENVGMMHRLGTVQFESKAVAVLSVAITIRHGSSALSFQLLI